MKLIIAALCCIGLLAAQASADCTDQANDAWRRLLETPFRFEISVESEKRKNIGGAFRWPSAMHYWTDGSNGRQEELFVGLRSWDYHDGHWSGGFDGSDPRRSAEAAMLLYGAFFGFRNLVHAKPLERPVACAEQVMRKGREQLVYEYTFSAPIDGRERIYRERIYVDAQTGVLTRQEIEPANAHDLAASSQRRSTEFRVDPSLKIDPPQTDED